MPTLSQDPGCVIFIVTSFRCRESKKQCQDIFVKIFLDICCLQRRGHCWIVTNIASFNKHAKLCWNVLKFKHNWHLFQWELSGGRSKVSWSRLGVGLWLHKYKPNYRSGITGLQYFILHIKIIWQKTWHLTLTFEHFRFSIPQTHKGPSQGGINTKAWENLSQFVLSVVIIWLNSYLEESISRADQQASS